MSAAAIGLALALVLTGCESGFFEGPVAIRYAENDLLVAICVDAQVTSVSGAERQSGLLRSWKDFWVAEGEIDVVAGTVFSVGGDNTGLVAELNRVPELDRGDELDITFVDAGASVIGAVLVVGEEGVPHEGWLQSDGSVTEEPCL